MAQKLEDLSLQLKQANQDVADMAKERNLAQQLANKRAHELVVSHSLINEYEKKVKKMADENKQLMFDLKHERQR